MAGNTFHHPMCPVSSYNKYPLNWISICFYHSCMHFFCPLPAWKGEKAMASHSSTVAWKIPWTEEPGRLQSMGSLRVRHDWVTSHSLFTFMHWRRKWQPISSSAIPFSSCPQSFPASGSFQMSQLFSSGGQSIEVSASTSVLPMNRGAWWVTVHRVARSQTWLST